jgi:hypothetical protein
MSRREVEVLMVEDDAHHDEACLRALNQPPR